MREAPGTGFLWGWRSWYWKDEVDDPLLLELGTALPGVGGVGLRAGQLNRLRPKPNIEFNPSGLCSLIISQSPRGGVSAQRGQGVSNGLPGLGP